jgi:SAM-dependent methyltransferase
MPPLEFPGNDQEYLRSVQYKDPTRLTARADLHRLYSTATQPWFAWVVAQIEWPEAADVLDIGCGPGWLWAEQAMHLPQRLRITLADLTQGMVEAAHQRVSALQRFHLSAPQVADVQALPFDDESFDIVVANHMLYHAPDTTLAAREIARVLRPDGVLLATANGPSHLREIWEIRAEVFGGTPTSAHIEAFGSETGHAPLEKSFSDVQWFAYTDEIHCPDPDAVVAFITSSPPAEHATSIQLHELRVAVERRMVHGSCVIAKESGAFVARHPQSS